MQPKPFERGDLVTTDDGHTGTIAKVFMRDGVEHAQFEPEGPGGRDTWTFETRQLAHVLIHFHNWTDDELIELWASTPQRKGHSRAVDYARRVLKGKPV